MIYIKTIKNNIGNTAIEYALIIFLISMMIFTGISFMGFNVKTTFCKINDKIGVLSKQNKQDCYVAKGVDSNFVDSSLGGDESIINASNWASRDDATETDAQSDTAVANNLAHLLSRLNEKDPVIGIYGLYDNSQNLVSTYNDAEQVLNSNTRTINNDWSDGRFAYTLGGNQHPYFEVATASGKVYYGQRNGWSENASLVEKGNPSNVMSSGD